jgi:hypothetical protein
METDGYTLVRQHVFCSTNPRAVETQEGQADDVFGVGTRRRIRRIR